jgi:hypothetical protein
MRVGHLEKLYDLTVQTFNEIKETNNKMEGGRDTL